MTNEQEISMTPSINHNERCLFVVYKQGYYGQGVHAVGLTVEEGVALTNESVLRDVDSYHSYDLYRVPVGRIPEMPEDALRDFGWMNRDCIYSAKLAMDDEQSKSIEVVIPLAE